MVSKCAYARFLKAPGERFALKTLASLASGRKLIFKAKASHRGEGFYFCHARFYERGQVLRVRALA